MQRFAQGHTQIMVATTVIEVGVNVPNASVMVIESATRFGLSQLHQLRGRVGRGANQSFCILMSDKELGKEARRRLETMVRTQDGFEREGPELRGPGDLMGTQRGAGPPGGRFGQDRALEDVGMWRRILKVGPQLEFGAHALLRRGGTAGRSATGVFEPRPGWRSPGRTEQCAERDRVSLRS